MSPPTDLRNFPRYTVQLPLLCRPATAIRAKGGAGWTHNLSEGGVCVELSGSFQVQTPLWVRLRTDQGAIEADVRITWTGEAVLPSGGTLHGVAFAQVPANHSRAVQDLLISNGLSRPAGVRLPLEVGATCRLKGKNGPPLEGGTRDISRGGVLVRLPQVLPLGTALELSLHTSAGLLTAEGAVVWVAPPEGRTRGQPIRHGMRFTTFDWTNSVALAFVLTGSPKGFRRPVKYAT